MERKEATLTSPTKCLFCGDVIPAETKLIYIQHVEPNPDGLGDRPGIERRAWLHIACEHGYRKKKSLPALSGPPRELTREDVKVSTTDAKHRPGSVDVSVHAKCSAPGCTQAANSVKTVRIIEIDSHVESLVQSLNRKSWRIDLATNKPLCPIHSGAESTTNDQRVRPK